MPTQYWRTDGLYHPGVPGIGVLVPDVIEESDFDTGQLIRIIQAPVGFQAYVLECLNWLHLTPVGQRILPTISNAANCTIAFSVGNSAGVGNMQAAMTLVAGELAGAGPPGANTQNALRRSFNAYGARHDALSFKKTASLPDQYAWLAAVVNAQPWWRIDREPGSDGGLGSYVQKAKDAINRFNPMLWTSDPNGGYFDEDRWFSTQGQSRAGLNLTAAEAQTWITQGTMPVRLSEAEQEQLRLATIVGLEEFATRGAGASSAIRFAVEHTDGFKNERPPAIALGHELLHAYFSLRGQQPGIEFSHFSTVLFEFKCVGLGPWNEHATSENSLRKEWPTVAATINGLTHPYDKKSPGKRLRY